MSNKECPKSKRRHVLLPWEFLVRYLDIQPSVRDAAEVVRDVPELHKALVPPTLL